MVDVDLRRLRAWWAHRQGLDGGLRGSSAAQVLDRTRWARSVGGCTAYLGLFARAGLDREAVDRDVATLDIHELPSARGCTYILPSGDFALGLTVGAGAPEADIVAAGKFLGVTREEIDRLAAALLDVLDGAKEPMEPAALRTAVGDAVRSLGEEGKKRGQTTTLPMTLGLLQARGEIRRVPVNGRLDQQRYGYVRWAPSPLAGGTEAEAARAGLAARYFAWAGPASLKHFRWFSGFTAAQAKAATAPLGLVPLAGTELLALPEQVDELASYAVPKRPEYALVTAIDGVHLLHRDLGRLLDAEDAARPQPAAKPGRTLGDEPDPQCPIIVDRGRIVGLWEYDVDTATIAYQSFVKPDAALKDAVARTESFVRDQLGDARTFSLDSPKSRAPRIAALRPR